MRKGYRQGDVLMKPGTAKGERMKPKNGLFTVAYGEQTGHHHSIPATANVAALLHRDGMSITGVGELTHQEHDPHAFDGEYEVVLQRRASEHRTLRAAD